MFFHVFLGGRRPNCKTIPRCFMSYFCFLPIILQSRIVFPIFPVCPFPPSFPSFPSSSQFFQTHDATSITPVGYLNCNRMTDDTDIQQCDDDNDADGNDDTLLYKITELWGNWMVHLNVHVRPHFCGLRPAMGRTLEDLSELEACRQRYQVQIWVVCGKTVQSKQTCTKIVHVMAALQTKAEVDWFYTSYEVASPEVKETLQWVQLSCISLIVMVSLLCG